MATYTIDITGYGAEVSVGTLTEDQYNFWLANEEGLEAHTFYDPYESDQDDEYPNPITDTNDPNFLGYWHDLDDIEHTNGAFLDNLLVEVSDEEGNVVWSSDDIQVVRDNMENFDEDNLEPGYYTYAYSSEKGGFYSGEFEADVFDPAKLTFNGVNIMGDIIVDSVHYNSEYVDNDGGDTRGKSQGIELIEIV